MGVMNRLEAAFLRFHGAVYVRSDGRIGHHLIMVPSLLLRTTGRRTGVSRTTALIYARDGDDLVLVASNHGWAKEPGWYLNVQADPNVGIQLGRRRGRGVARVVSKGEPDYDRLWHLANDNNHGRYDSYQRGTSRPIPLVVVRPV